MKKALYKIALATFVFGILTMPFVSEAAVIRTDKTAVVEAKETVFGNVYLIGSEPKISGKISGDLFAAGSDILSEGTVEGDILSFGGYVNIKGKNAGDVRVLGGTVLVENEIEGDLVVIGSRVILSENAKINGDIILIGGVIELKNTSNKHLRIISGSTIISGKILSTANITSEKISILKSSEISGNLSYFSPRQAIIDGESKISGSVNFNKVDSIKENGLVKHLIISFLNFWMVFRFITTLVLTFILVYVFKIFSQKTATESLKNFWKNFAIGLMSFAFVPIIIIVLLFSLILFPVAVLLGMVYTGVFIIAYPIASMVLGVFLRRTFTKNKSFEISFQTATIGVVVLTLLQFVSVLGDLTRFVFMLTAFGSVWIYLYRKVRWGNVVSK